MTTKEKYELFKGGFCQHEFEGKKRCSEQCYFCEEYQKDPDDE